jgi:RHS repeat-associated protein
MRNSFLSARVSFKYDPFGRRIYKSSSATTSVYAYDGDNLIEESNSSGTAIARYSQGLNIDEPLAMLRSATTSFYDADGLGSITSLSSNAGALAQTYTFDSFGKQTNSSGSLTNSFQYTGREFDPETSLYHYRARYYDPNIGRFLSEDPVGFGGGTNFYSYVLNNPVLFNDPYGLWRNTGRPAKPKLNTIVCNGLDGIRVQIGSPGTPEQANCYGDCMRQHEESHKNDALASNPTVCKGAADGIQVGFSNERERRPSEIVASTVEIDCLNSKKQQKGTCDRCNQLIDQRIQQMENYRNGFQKK